MILSADELDFLDAVGAHAAYLIPGINRAGTAISEPESERRKIGDKAF